MLYTRFEHTNNNKCVTTVCSSSNALFKHEINKFESQFYVVFQAYFENFKTEKL